MGKELFTMEELAALRANPGTASAGFSSIRFTEEFRARIWKELQNGGDAASVLQAAGYDLEVLGDRRIQALASKVRCQGRRGVFDAVEDASAANGEPAPEDLQARIACLEAKMAIREEREAAALKENQELKSKLEFVMEAMDVVKKVWAARSRAAGGV